MIASHADKPGAFVKRFWGSRLAAENVDDANRIVRHRQILEHNRVLRACYERWYREFLPAADETASLGGDLIEVGCGAGFMDEVIPVLVKTDVVANPLASRIMDATRLDVPDASLRGIFLTAVLHHIDYPLAFLREADRSLKRGGRLVMIEPNNSVLMRVLCKYLDHYEYFDATIADWCTPDANVMTNANLAVPWVIFVRDRAKFQAMMPGLRIKRIRYHTFISYVVSGGMSYRQFIPNIAIPLVNLLEWTLSPLMKWLGTNMTIELEKV